MRKLPTESAKVSIIIPARSERLARPALTALQSLEYPPHLIEVWLSLGSAPSRQRNAAVRRAKGDYLYFLDNDSVPNPKVIRQALAVFFGKQKVGVEQVAGRGFSIFPDWVTRLIVKRFFSGQMYRGEIGAVGGPNVWTGPESFWQAISSVCLESFFTHFLMAARYRPIGDIRRATEKELILCNLMMKRNVFMKEKGFSERLYPNEENELLNRLEKQGLQLIYEPAMVIERPRRQSWFKLVKAFFRYGRGRIEQIRLEGPAQNWLFFFPLGLMAYLLTLFFYHPFWYGSFLGVYVAAAMVSALGFASRRKKAWLVFFLPVVYLTVHLAYAVGSLKGLGTDLEERQRRGRRRKIELKKVKSFGLDWSLF